MVPGSSHMAAENLFNGFIDPVAVASPAWQYLDMNLFLINIDEF